MSKKNIILGIITTAILMCIFVLPSYGAKAWYYCTIDQLAPLTDGTIKVYLTDTAATPAFTNKTFLITADAQTNKKLAICLSAITGDMTVYVNVDPVPAALTDRTMTTIYLMKN